MKYLIMIYIIVVLVDIKLMYHVFMDEGLKKSDVLYVIFFIFFPAINIFTMFFIINEFLKKGDQMLIKPRSKK
jgi:hypothetical protein